MIAAPGFASASEGAAGVPQDHDGQTAEEHEQQAAGEHEGAHSAKNSLHLMVGETWERVDGADITEKGFTFGVEYFRAVAPRWAIGAVFERAGGDIRGTLLLAQVEFNLVGGLWVVTGPGVEFRDAHEEGPEHHGAGGSIDRASHDVAQLMRERDTTVFVYRIGLGYGFPVGDMVLSPTVDVDFVGRDTALVVGMIVAVHF